MSGLLNKLKEVKTKIKSRLDPDSPSMSRTSSLRSTLLRSLSRRDKKKGDIKIEGRAKESGSSQVDLSSGSPKGKSEAQSIEISLPETENDHTHSEAAQSSEALVQNDEQQQKSVSENVEGNEETHEEEEEEAEDLEGVVSESAPLSPIQLHGKSAHDQIQATSTPLQENPDDTESLDSKIVTIQEALANGADETVPLLAHHGNNQYSDLENWPGVDDGQLSVNRRPFPWRLTEILLLILLIVLVGLFVFFAVRDMGHHASDVFQTDIQSISLLGLKDDGASFQLIGSLTVLYGRLSSKSYTHFFRGVGALIGGVTVLPKNAAQIFIKPQGLNRTHLASLFPLEMPVDLVDGRISEIDILSDIQFDESTIGKISLDLLQMNRLHNIEILVDVVTDLQIKVFFLTLDAGPISFTKNVVISSSDLQLPLVIDDIEANLSRSHMDLAILGHTTKRLPVHMTFDELEWMVALPDCKGKPSVLGTWISDSFLIDPSTNSTLAVHGVVEHIPDSLLEVCEDKQTPFNKFCQELSQKKEVHALIRAEKSTNNEKHLPTWLYKILTSQFIEIDIPGPDIDGVDLLGRLYNWTIYDLDVVVSPNEDPWEVELSSSVEAYLHTPFEGSGIELLISRIKLEFSVFDIDKLLFVATTGGSCLATLVDDQTHVSRVHANASDVKVRVNEPAEMGRQFMLLLNGEELVFSTWNLHLEEALLELPIVSTTLRNLDFRPLSSFLNYEASTNSSFLDWLMESIHPKVMALHYMESSENEVLFMIDIDLVNPLNASLAIPDEVVHFDYKYNDTQIGSLSWMDVKVARTPEIQSFLIGFKLTCTTLKQRALAENFVSQLISGVEGLEIQLQGNGAEVNQRFGDFLREVKIDKIVLPTLSINRPDEDEAARPMDTRSPFLVDATFHLLTSEIELTVFNPVSNAEIIAELVLCRATYEGQLLATMDRLELMVIPPGIYKTPRLPIKVSQGIGSDILRRALNGDLQIEAEAELKVRIDKFHMELLCHGHGLGAKVRL